MRIIGLLIAILAIIIAFQNGGKMISLDLFFWEMKTSHGLVIIGSLIVGLIIGGLIQIRGR